VGTGVLNIYDNGCFEIEYETYSRPKDIHGKIFYGTGSYSKEKGKLELHFETMPEYSPSMSLTKIGDSDKVDIKVSRVFDPTNNEQIRGASFSVCSRKGKKIVKEIYYDPQQEEHLIFDLNKTRLGSDAFYLESSFIGCYTATAPLPRPGVYTAEIVLPVGYADVKFKSGEHKQFSVKNAVDGVIIRDLDDRRIYFTMMGCECD